MSKQVKQMICDELNRRLGEVDACVVIDPTLLDGVTANNLRREMSAANIEMLLVKNSLASRALADKPLSAVSQLLEGPCALTWGGESIVDVAKLIAKKAKELPNLTVRGAVMEGRALDGKAAMELAKLPSKAEMKARLVAQVLSPGANLAGAVLGAGSMLANLLKGRIEQLEKQGGGEPAAA